MKRCRACGGDFPATPEYFVPLKVKGWRGLSSECRPCRNLRFKPYYAAHRERLVAKAAAHTKAFRATEAGKVKDREQARNRARRMLADPIKREAHVARNRQWVKDNPERAAQFKHAQKPYRAERVMRRYARQQHATPAWADHEKIATIYAIAAFLTEATGVEHQVDHYYPIMGRLSCGLHVHQNMRVITGQANRSKGNRHPE